MDLGRGSAALSEPGDALQTLAFSAEAGGHTWRIELSRSAAPTTPGYTSYVVKPGAGLVPVGAPVSSCTYDGRVVSVDAAGSGGSDLGFAAVSTCSDATGFASGEALSGTLYAAGRYFRIRPNAEDQDVTDGVDHWLEPLHRPDAPVDVVEAPLALRLRRAPESPSPRLEYLEGTPLETKYVELVVVNDAARVARLGGQVENAGISFVQTMNAILAESNLVPRLRVALRAQVFFEADPYQPAFVEDEVDHDSLIEEFLGWAATADLPPHDEHMLLSGLDFLANTVGYAGLGAACTPRNNGFIVQATNAGGGFSALSAVHELGHTVGMNHDDGIECPNQGFIMAAVGCANCASDNQFSACSLEQFASYLAGPAYAEGGRCADDLPDGSGIATCGDGVVSEGEACDCGAADCADIDPCCDGESCQLVAGAECSDFNDGCCQGCSIVSAEAEVVCRSQRSACDVEEVCTGTSKSCPADNFEAAGTACEDDRGNAGTCYFGDCRSRATQCELIAEQQQSFGQQNFAQVGGPGPNCQQSCGQVVCGLTNGGCITIQGPSVLDGVACGDGQCVNEACVPSVDECPSDPEKTHPGDCGCNTPDVDTDQDALADCVDACPDDAAKQTPGACGCGVADTDSDDDGAPDCDDACPDDAGKQAPGLCGCGTSDEDTDADGTPDCSDECLDDATATRAGACGCGVPEVDSDGDGTPDCVDACPETANRTLPPCDAPGVAGEDSTSEAESSGRGARLSASASGGCALAAPATGTPHGAGSLAWLLACSALPLLRRRSSSARR